MNSDLLHRIATATCLAASVSLSGCGALQGKGATTFVGTADKADQVVDDLLTAQGNVLREEKFSGDSYFFLKGRKPENGVLCLDQTGKAVTLEKELEVRKFKKEQLKALKDYINQVKAYLSPSDGVATARNLIEAAAALSGKYGGTYGSAAALGGKLASQLITAGDELSRAKALHTLAEKEQGNVEKISSSLERAVRPINAELDARLNTWEVCEYSKMLLIQNSPDASLIEKEARYRQFFETKAKLRAQIDGAEQAEELFKKIPELHAQIIADAQDIRNNYEQLKKLQELTATVEELNKKIDAFHAQVEAKSS